MERECPPLEDCHQMESGLLGPYLTNNLGKTILIPIHSTPSNSLYVKSYLTAVRKSRGYDVYEGPLGGSFVGVLEREYSCPVVIDLAEFLVDHITRKTGKAHKLVHIQKVVMTVTRGVLLTIFAKEETEEAREVVYLGSVFMEGFSKQEFVLLECFIKPDEDAPESQSLICRDGNLACTSFAPYRTTPFGPGQIRLTPLTGPPHASPSSRPGPSIFPYRPAPPCLNLLY